VRFGSDPRTATRRSRLRRTWPQRLVIGFNSAVVLSCLAGAAGLAIGKNKVDSIQRIAVDEGVLDEINDPAQTDGAIDTGGPLPAENWLITGSDARTKDNCNITNPQYAGAFEGDQGAPKSDTIMVLRIDPDSNFAAILSFPRDLRLKVAGHPARINTAFKPFDPTQLIKTIQDNFKIPINHYANIGFCGFKDLIDVVGGVKIPFDRYARDKNTGLDVAPGCFTFNGEAGLAYARSRHLEYSVDGRRWIEDGASDWSRVRRQQDLIKRVAQKVSDQGIATNIRKLNSFVNAGLQAVQVQNGVSVDHLLKLARRMRAMDPSTIRTFTVEGENVKIRGFDYVKLLDTDNNRKVYEIFRGNALPADAKTAEELEGAATSTTAAPSDSGAPETTAPTRVTGASSTPGATTTTGPLATVQVAETNAQQVNSFVPPDDPTCR
jgi:polyisoprenyl-teichoic acid--peptidoglycan teichoic acid transferase